MSERIRVGVTEAAHMRANPHNLVKPLSTRAVEAEKMGFHYEAMPGWTTSLESVFLLENEDRRRVIKERVVTIHSPWTDDRRVHPAPEQETLEKRMKRTGISHVMSASFLSYRAMGTLSKETKAPLATNFSC